MNPSTSNKHSRRSSSSILKGPKMQKCKKGLSEETPSSSVESTPSRLKRRVSFAGKKHVKEFCDSMEQGTVWDNTYEESDSSHMAKSHNDDHQPQLSSQEDSDASPILEFTSNHPRHGAKSKGLNPNFINPDMIENYPELFVEKENIPMNPMADVSSPEEELIPLQVTQKVSCKFSIYCDDDSPSSQEKVENTTGNKSDDRTLTLTDSCRLEFIENDQNLTRESSKTPLPRRSIFEGMEMTEALSSVLGIMGPKNNTENPQDLVDPTEAIPSVLPHKSVWNVLHATEDPVNPQRSTRKSLLNPEAMEMTQVISPSFRTVDVSSENGSELQYLKDSSKDFPTKKTACEGMEMTEALSSVLGTMEHKIVNPQNLVDPTESNPSVLPRNTMRSVVREGENAVNPQRFTRKSLLNPEAMEMTEAITPSFPGGGLSHNNITPSLLKNSSKEFPVKKSTCEGMEMTEALSSVLGMMESRDKTESPQDLVDPTEAIPSVLPQKSVWNVLHATEDVVNPKRSTRKSLINSEAMEMTEAIIPSFPLGEVSLDHGIKPTSLEDTSEEFPVKRNACEGMEMTEALSSVLGTMAPRHNIENPQDLVDPTEAIPSVLPHKSVWNVLHTDGVANPKRVTRKSLLNAEAMEMTEAITPSFPLGEVPVDRGIKPASLKTTSKEIPVKKSACEGMEMTEALSSVLGTMAPRHNIENPQDLVDPTEAMPSVLPHKSVWNVLHTEGVINPKKSTRKSLLNSEAMEMTEAITPSFPPGAVLNDSGMELTKAINRLQPTSEPENRSRCFQQDGMDLTEAIPPHVPVQELNMSYHNYFMELTEAIPSLKRSHAIISTSGNSTSTSPCSKSPKGLFSQEEPSQKDKNALHHLLHPDSPKLSSELQNQSMEFTRPVRPQHLKNVVNNDSVEMTECSIPLIPISEKRTPSETIAQCNGHFQENPLKDITYRIHPRPAVPTDISGTESSDSFKENRTPPDYPSMHPVARPLFEGPSEDLSYSSPVPLESEDFAESIRSSAVIGVRNLEDVCMELTEAFTKPGDHGALGSSDLQNIEAPSFMFEDSASVNRSDDSKLLRAAMQIGDQEMAGDFRSVPVPEAEFTEDISNFQFRKNGEDVQRNQMEDESSRNCRSFQEEGIPETSEDGQEASTGHETHIILRHKKEEKKMIKQVGNKQILVIESQSSSQSMEVDGEMRVEMFDETVVMCQEKVPNLSLEEKLSGDGENESQEKENCALVDTSDEPKKEVLGGAVYAAYVAHLARVHEENDVIMKSIKRQRKMEEVDRQKLAEMQNKETDSSKTSGIDPQEEDDLELTPFELMKKNLEERASRHCMWILCRCTEEKVFIEFKKTAFVFGIIFVTPVDDDGIGMIRDFYKVPRMADTEIPFRRILDPLMMEKINVEELRMKYSTYADVLPLLEAVSQDARFIYDFYENLVRLSFRDVVKVTMEKISFHVSTASMDTILEVFVNVKPFHQITPDDVYVKCNLGNVRKSHIKALINNVSKTPKFLTMYRNEIKDYIELMELASNSKK